MPKPREPLGCVERVRLSPDETVHPGWIRATLILLRGMERLRIQDAEAGKD
jgi:hypothetical protein